ncbi:(E3-independent) E2 ubiquitin-conjugating enzyme UBE2O [Nymphon striatum]|nr:(E3-independent) E2 ubiquitin-conjugating enzyme UBE2O [Nymphon striatum]
MAARSKYFYEDSVCISHGEKVYFGIVTENDEYISSGDEDFEGDKSCEFRPLQKGEVRVSWHPSGREVVMSQKTLKLADRSLMPGDVVRRNDNKRAVQCGFCIMTHITADVKLLSHDLVIYSVPSSDLISLEEFQEDHAVVLDAWTGVIVKVESDVTMRACDGSKLIMPFDDAIELVEILHSGLGTSNQFNNFIYPAQSLHGPAMLFKSVKWIHKASNVSTLWKSNPDKHLYVTVEKIKTKSVSVNWQSMGFSPSNENIQNKIPPPYKIEGAMLNRLKILKSLDSCSLQIGDKKNYKIPENSVMITKDEWKQKRYQEICDIPVCENKSILLPISENQKSDEAENVCDQSTVEQNSTEHSFQQINGIDNGQNDEELGSEFEDLDNSDELESDTGSTFITNLLKKKKLKRAQKKEKDSEVPPPIPSVGDCTVVEVLNTRTIVDVMWQDGTREKDIPASELFPVNHVEDHEYFPGDFIVESKDGASVDLSSNLYGVIQSVNFNARIAQVKWMQTQISSPSDLVPQVVRTEEVSVYDLIEHPDFTFRAQTVVCRIADLQSEPQIIEEEFSPAGQVISINLSGMVEIEWSNGKRSLCYPQELEVLGDYDSDDSLFGDGDDSSSEDDSNSSWETESEESSEESSLNETQSNDSMIKAIKLMHCVVKLSHSLENLVKTPALIITKPSIKKLLEIFKKAREVDSKLGMTHFDTDELKALAKQLQDKKIPNQSKIEKFTELFDIPSESVPNLCEDLNKLKMSWDKDVAKRSKSTSSLSKSASTTPKTDSLKKIDSLPEASASSDSSASNSKPMSRKDLVLIFISKLRLALIALSRDLKADSEDQGAICQLNASKLGSKISACDPLEDVDDDFISTIEKQCQELDQSNTSISASRSHLGFVRKPWWPLEDKDVTKITNQTMTPERNEDTQPKEVDASSSRVEEPSDHDQFATSNSESDSHQGNVGFILTENAPNNHYYINVHVAPVNPTYQFKAIRKEWMLLKNGVPDGIIVKVFEDRMDLLSIMIKGPTRTPYEDGLFFFDLQLPGNYPSVPPVCHYIAFCTERLNPNLYEEGKVCVSLLGTWGGKGTEVWTSNSTLLQLIISIQGLILVPEPYYNEPGHEAQRNTTQGKENSRMYNEMAVLKLTQSMTRLLKNLPSSFADDIEAHYKSNVLRLINRFEKWLNMSESWNQDHPQTPTSPTVYREAHVDSVPNTDEFYLPEFPLLPASKGFCLSLRKALSNLKESMKSKWPHLEL